MLLLLLRIAVLAMDEEVVDKPVMAGENTLHDGMNE